MVGNLAKKIAERMLLKNAIKEDELELYIYGLFMLISHLIFFAFTAIVGLVLGCFFESLIFYVAFQFIRRYAGGYHAKTEARCEISTIASLVISIIIIMLSKKFDFQLPLLIITAIFAVCIFFFCPLDTPEKPLSDKERSYFRKISWLILLIICVLIAVSYFFKLKFAFSPLCISLVLEGILITAGKIKSLSVKSHKDCGE